MYIFSFFCFYKLPFIFTQEYLTEYGLIQFNQHCSQKQNVTVWLHSALFIKMSVSQKINLCKLFKSILCSSKVFYASFLK